MDRTTFSVPCRGGREFSFGLSETALLAIDMQRDFLDPRGMCAASGDDIAPLRAIIPTVLDILAAARGAGIAVIHTREGYTPGMTDVHPMKRERGVVGRVGPLGRFLIRGQPGHDFIDEFQPHSGEPVIDKPGFGAFYRTAMAELLAERGIRRLIVTGITTQCCVHSTLREAVDRGFYCLTVADGCAAIEPRLHQATLDIIQGENHLFGWIADSDRLLAALERT